MNATATQISRTLKKEESWWSHYYVIERIQRDGLVTPEGSRRWKYDQRVALHSGLLSEDKTAALAKLGIHPFASPAAREWAAQYEAFIHEHGSKPSSLSEDTLERTLAAAARRYKTYRTTDTRGLKTKKTEAREKLWQENFAALTRWTEAHGRMPKMRAPDATESTMANFVNVQRRHLAAGKLPEHRENLLRGIRGALEPRPKDRDPAIWGAMLEEFFVEHARFPSTHSDDPAERSLKLAMERHGLDVSAELKPEIWWRNMAAVRRWCDANGRLPHTRSEDAAEAEAASWWGLKRWHMSAAGVLNLEAERAIGALLMALAKGNRCPKPGSLLWREQLETLRAFHDAFHRWPKRCADPLENSLAYWAQSQRGRYARGSLPSEAAEMLQEAAPWVLATDSHNRGSVGLAA